MTSTSNNNNNDDDDDNNNNNNSAQGPAARLLYLRWGQRPLSR